MFRSLRIFNKSINSSRSIQLFNINRQFMRNTTKDSRYENKHLSTDELKQELCRMDEHQLNEWVNINADIILDQVVESIDQQSLDNKISYFIQHRNLMFKNHQNYIEIQKSILNHIQDASSEDLIKIQQLNFNEVKQQHDVNQLIFKQMVQLILQKKSKINHLACLFPVVIGINFGVTQNHFTLLKKYVLKNIEKANLYELGLIFNGIARLKEISDLYDKELNDRLIQKFITQINQVKLNELNTFLTSTQILMKYEDNEIYQRVDEIVLQSNNIFENVCFNDICKLVLLTVERCHNSHFWDILSLKLMENLKIELQQHNDINTFIQSLSYLIMAVSNNQTNNQLNNIKDFVYEIFLQQLKKQKEQKIPLIMQKYLEMVNQFSNFDSISNNIWHHLAEMLQGQFSHIDHFSFITTFDNLVQCHQQLPGYFIDSLMDDLAERREHIAFDIIVEIHQMLHDKRIEPSTNLQEVFDMYKLDQQFEQEL